MSVANQKACGPTCTGQSGPARARPGRSISHSKLIEASKRKKECGTGKISQLLKSLMTQTHNCSCLGNWTSANSALEVGREHVTMANSTLTGHVHPSDPDGAKAADEIIILILGAVVFVTFALGLVSQVRLSHFGYTLPQCPLKRYPLFHPALRDTNLLLPTKAVLGRRRRRGRVPVLWLRRVRWDECNVRSRGRHLHRRPTAPPIGDSVREHHPAYHGYKWGHENGSRC